ncbi:nmrA-like family protein [Sarocladium implicatum]|jgi:hypothetical protein|nr:nmrA-like family protein [Sarocladium implicatum]
MSSNKIIAIVGATGTQGGSVARTFLNLSPQWHVRCLTRNTSSASAQALAQQGAEVVTADLDNPASLRKAFEGAHVIFVNTDFWATYLSLRDTKGYDDARKAGYETEVRHARNAAEAAAQVSTLERYIYSALGPMKRASNGKYASDHWETKAATVDHIEANMSDLAAKTSFIYIGAYAHNPFLIPKPNKADPSGPYEYLVNCGPSTVFPIIDTANSTGPFVHALINEPPRTKLLAYDSMMKASEAVDIWERLTGKKAKFEQLPTEQMTQRTGLTVEVLGGPAFIDEFGYMAGIEGWIGPDKLQNKPQTPSYEEFLSKQSSEHVLGAQFPPL